MLGHARRVPHTPPEQCRTQRSGSLPHTPSASDRAVPGVAVPETRGLEESMLFPFGKQVPVVPMLRKHLAREGRLCADAALRLIRSARELFSSLPNVIRVSVPVVIFGDIHGQFYDLAAMIDAVGAPSETNKYLFLGDYVDRGFFSTEVVFYLIAHALCYPNYFFLLRGNHESRLTSSCMTFRTECLRKYDQTIYNEFQLLFDSLPLAAVVRGAQFGECFCVHGGLSPALASPGDLDAVDRFVEVPASGVMCDVLWGSLMKEAPGQLRASWQRSDWCRQTAGRVSRGYLYGPLAVSRFLRANGLACVIRGHEVQQEGFGRHFPEARTTGVPPVVTVFSAPNYGDQVGNKAAVAVVGQRRIEIRQFESTEHPFCLPGFSDAITFTLPYLFEYVARVLQELVRGIKAEHKDGGSEREREADAVLSDKMRKLCARAERLRAQQEEYLRVLQMDYHEKMPLFESLRVINGVRSSLRVPPTATPAATILGRSKEVQLSSSLP
eukprot:m51a1_g7230 hypothetical protein (497) ;mRNA; f:34632-36821